MKKQQIRYAILYCTLALIWGILIASLFMGCNVYETETVEIIRCPVIEADTIEIPDWRMTRNKRRQFKIAAAWFMAVH